MWASFLRTSLSLLRVKQSSVESLPSETVRTLQARFLSRGLSTFDAEYTVEVFPYPISLCRM